MINKSITLTSAILLLVPLGIISCATAPNGYVNKEDYMYVDGYKDDAAIVFTVKLFDSLYDLPMENNCPLDLKITQLNGQYSGWNGVTLLEIRPGYHYIYVGVVGAGIPSMELNVDANKVYILNCRHLTNAAWVDELIGAQYIPKRKVFVYEGREYEVP
jgi:hypothetical protein